MGTIHRKCSADLPRIWLMTDERVKKKALIRAVRRLPRGAGVVFRHYGLKPRKRRALFARVLAAARPRGVRVLLAGTAAMAQAWGADGWHGATPGMRRNGAIHTAPAHSPAQMRRAERAGVDALFVSPVFATRSHPKARPLGAVRFGLLARQARKPVIALGGMTARRGRALRAMGAHGWAAIDALSG